MKAIEYWIYTIAVVILVVACAISGGFLAITGDTPNLGFNDDGSFTVQQAPDPNNKLHRPIGEVLGMEKDANGHWSRAR